MIYKVVYPTPAAERNVSRFLGGMPAGDADVIMEAILSLGAKPRPTHSIKLDPPIHIFSALAERRLKIGYYRVFYDVDDQKRKVYIYGIRRRDKDTYR